MLNAPCSYLVVFWEWAFGLYLVLKEPTKSLFLRPYRSSNWLCISQILSIIYKTPAVVFVLGLPLGAGLFILSNDSFLL